MTVELMHGDCLDVMAGMVENSVDTIITDPPYGLKFMGKQWDHGVPGAAYWKAALRVAKPGAMMLAFGGTRTHHRLMCAIEDAGWVIRDCLMWLYGSGFPKSHDISKAIDKSAGATREVVGKSNTCVGPSMSEMYGHREGRQWTEANAITAPATPEAATWDGYGTALKPAWEPIILAMAPLDGTFAHNALTWGVGGLNIDGGRVAHSGNEDLDAKQVNFDAMGYQGANSTGGTSTYKPAGRWPANLILSHSPGCKRVGVRKVKGDKRPPGGTGGIWSGVSNRPVSGGHASPDGTETIAAWDCVEGCPVAMLDAQSGERPSTGFYRDRGKEQKAPAFFGNDRVRSNELLGAYSGETGGASRFFQHCNWGEDDVRFYYCAKASRKERNKGLEGMPLGAPPESGRSKPAPGRTSALGAPRANTHPTVKPLALMRYLVKLTKTPTLRDVILDPFMGSGSTGVAAVLEGRDFVGIELGAESYDIATRRIEAAQTEVVQWNWGDNGFANS